MWEIREHTGGDGVFIDTPVPMTYALRDAVTDWVNLGAVMMDMDGSSTDTEKLVLEAMRQMMSEALGKAEFKFADDDYPNIIGDSTTNHVSWLIRKYDLSVDDRDELIANYYAKYHQTLRDIRDGKIKEHLIEPMPHLRKFLAWARERDLKIGLVTSSLELEVDIVMPKVFKGMDMNPNYREFYDGVIAADAVGEPFLKPHPNLYILMREMLGVPAHRAIVIEDSTAGIVAGRLSGSAVAAVPHPHTRDHQFSLADLGVFPGGLAELQERMEELMGAKV